MLISPKPDPTEETIETSPFFVRRGGHLLPRRPGWTENLLDFLSGLQKLEFGRCSLFPSWSGYGLISTLVCAFMCCLEEPWISKA